MNIQQVYIVHDWIYGSLHLIPEQSLDGKDVPAITYIVTDEDITQDEATNHFLYGSENEALESLQEI